MVNGQQSIATHLSSLISSLVNKLLFLLLYFPCIALAQSQRFYVNDDAFGLNNGQTWYDAFPNLHDALVLAEAGDEIWVAEGTYFPTESGDRAARFQLLSGVGLYGGFAGHEFLLEERQPGDHPSVLSGDIGVAGDSLDNSYTLLYLLNPALGTIVDGFVFRDALANDPVAANGAPGRSGAALYIMAFDGQGYPDIRHCVFEHNSSRHHGGAVFINGGGSGSAAPVFAHCQFFRNRSATANGGAIYRSGGSWLERPNDIYYCTFEENYAERIGGVLYFADSERSDTFQINHCYFRSNRSGLNTDAVSIGRLRSSNSFLYVDNSRFEGNIWNSLLQVDQFSSAGNLDFKVDSCVFFKISGLPTGLIDMISFSGNSYLEVTNCLVDSCKTGAVISTEEDTHNGRLCLIDNLKVTNSRLGTPIQAYMDMQILNTCFVDDTISTLLNALSNNILRIDNLLLMRNKIDYFSEVDTVSDTIINAVFYKNTFGRFIRNLSLFPPSNDNLGPSIINSNFADNIITSFFGPSKFYPNFYNCTFSENVHVLMSSTSPVGSIIVSYSPDFPGYHNCITDGSSLTGIYDSTTLLNTSPSYVNAAAGDFHLLPCSPGIDIGNNAIIDSVGLLTDISGVPRIQGGTVDIGAYEAPAFALSAAPGILPACSGAPGGAISLSPAYGCEPYTYTWQPPVGSGPVINDLPPGDYRYTVTDDRGRQIQDTLQVTTAPSPSIAALPQGFQCGSVLGGTATVTVSSGTAPFTFVWSNGASDSLLTMLPAGPYQVTVIDKNGCQDSAQLIIALNGQLTLQVDGVSISCFGAADAMLSVRVVNGKSPYTYLWSQGATDSLLTDLGPGQYTVTATDFYGCTASFTFTLSEPTLLQASVQTQPTSTLQNPNGSASAVPVSGGTQPYTYLWSNGGQTQTINNLAPGIYTVTVTDTHGCTASASAEVTLVVGTGEVENPLVQVWPNPILDRLEIQALSLPPGDWRFVLRDVLGRELRGEMLLAGRAVLDVAGLPAGGYSWELLGKSGEVLVVGKVVK